MLTERSPSSASALRTGWGSVALVLLVIPTLLIRLWLIRHCPEPDTDAPGHLGIARALLSDPTNVAIHWVWLPAYHFLLAAFLRAGLSADAIRVLNCALAALVPLLLLGYAESTASPWRTTEGQDHLVLARSERPVSGTSRYVPWMAAAFCAVSPLVNLLGTSAQQETLFTLLVLGAVWSIDLGRFALAGALLALASLIRYEAWGAVALLVGLRMVGEVPAIAHRLPKPVLRACRQPLLIVVPSLVAIGGWLLAHKLREGQWLGFLRELYRYTSVQRDSFNRDALWFPVRQPLYVFGWVVGGLSLFGVRRAWRPSHVVPLGIYLFLLGAYLFKGALDSARYYESLTPFVALSAAHGACAIGSRRRWLAPALFAVASWQLTTLSAQLCRWTWPSVGSSFEASSRAAAASAGFGSPSAPPPPPPSTRPPHGPRASRR